MSEIDADLAEMAGDIGVSVTIGATSYTAFLSDPEVGIEHETGGFRVDADYIIKIRRSLLGSIPALLTKIVVDTKPYRITGIVNHPKSALVQLHVQAA